jgi:GTPase
MVKDLPRESDDGNIEYKLKLLNLSNERKEQLTTQLNYRLEEGNGECFYEIGIMDNGIVKGISKNELEESLLNLKELSKKLNVSIIRISETKLADNKMIAEVLIRRNSNLNNYIDLKICVSGNVDSGKSTLIGVLTSGELDNGRGKTRLNVFTHPHEVESGRSSSVSLEIMGFNNQGECVNKNRVKKMSWEDIVKRSSKIITFYDLCGHEKYLRTTIYGYSMSHPDYSLIIVGSNMGITHMTKEHIFASIALKVPMIIILTKIDICPPEVLERTINNIKKLLKSSGIRKIPYMVKSEDDTILCSKNIISDNIVPIFKISNVSGLNMELLIKFLNLLPNNSQLYKNKNKHVEFNIDRLYQITGTGTVLSGLLKSGTVKIGDILYLGPDRNGNFKECKVKSIQCKRVSIESAIAGHYVCFGIKKLNKKFIKKGMVLVSKENIKSTKKFDAEIIILKSHHTTIRKNYQPILHVNNTRQAAKIIDIKNNNNILRIGDRTKVTFEFVTRPAYINSGDRVIFREGRLRGIGIIN